MLPRQFKLPVQGGSFKPVAHISFKRGHVHVKTAGYDYAEAPASEERNSEDDMQYRPRVGRGGRGRGSYNNRNFDAYDQTRERPQRSSDTFASESNDSENQNRGAPRYGGGRGGYGETRRGGYNGGDNGERRQYKPRYNSEGGDRVLGSRDGDEENSGQQGAGAAEEGGYNRRRYNNDGGEPRRYGGEGEQGRPYNGQRRYNNDGEEGSGFNGQRRYNSEGGERRGGYSRPQVSQEQLALRSGIYNMQTWRDAALLLSQYGSELNAENVAVMMMKIVKSENPDTPEAKAEYEALLGALYQYAKDFLPTFRPMNTATVLFSLGKLGYYDEELVNGLQAMAVQQAGNFLAKDWSSMIEGLGRLGAQPTEAWFDCFCRASGKLGDMNGYELGTVGLGITKSGRLPPAEWIAAYRAAALKMAPSLRDMDFINIFYALASFGLGPDQELIDGFLSATPSRPENLRSGDLNKVIWGLTQFSPARPSDEWLGAFLLAFERRLRYFSSSELSSTCYSMAYMEMGPFMSTSLVERLQSYIRMLIVERRMSGDELGEMALALATFNMRLNERWVDDFVLGVRDRLSTCSASGLSKLVSALPLLSSGYRLNEVVAEANQRLAALQEEAAAGESQQAEGVLVEAAPAEQEPVAA